MGHVESRIRNHLEPASKSILVNRFALAHVERYIDDRLEADAQPSTINRELAALRTALHLGGQRHLMNQIVEWTKLPEHNVRAGFLDHDDCRRLLHELPHELQLLVFGYHYGIWESELLSYRWTYVDWFAAGVRVPQPNSKNKEPKIIPFYGDVPSWLEREKARRDREYPDSPWIFSRAGKAIRDFRTSWYDAVERAGLQDSLGWFHDLRRSAARNMVNAGLDEKMAMRIDNWKTDSVFRRYRIIARRDLQRAAAKMNDFFQQEEEQIKKEATKRHSKRRFSGRENRMK